jgi:catechol 2,3-dioxygenase-like lactoylglutathione lyase family enzyme
MTHAGGATTHRSLDRWYQSPMTQGIRIDHVGVTVPDIEAATAFFVAAFDAVVLYDMRRRDEAPNGTSEAHGYLGIPASMAQGAMRMLALPEGPGLELFEYLGPDQRDAAHPSDLGWQHLALYTDDLDDTLARIEAAGGTRNSDPRPLRGLEAGAGNRFVYTRTPWGSTLELVTYPSPQPYLLQAPRAKWAPWPDLDDALRQRPRPTPESVVR